MIHLSNLTFFFLVVKYENQVIICALLGLDEYPGPAVIKLFSCSIQLSMKFSLPIKAKTLNDKEFSCLQTLGGYFYHATKHLSMIYFMLS